MKSPDIHTHPAQPERTQAPTPTERALLSNMLNAPAHCLNVTDHALTTLRAYVAAEVAAHSAQQKERIARLEAMLLRMADEARHQNQARNGFNPILEREARALLQPPATNK